MSPTACSPVPKSWSTIERSFHMTRLTCAVFAVLLAFVIPAGAQTRQVIVGTPGFTNTGGLDIITKAFEAETGIKVTIRGGGMDEVMKLATDGTVDAVFLPADHMDEV